MGHGKRDRLPCYQPVVLRPSAGGAQWQVEWLPISAERIIGGLGQGGMFLLQGLKLKQGMTGLKYVMHNISLE